MDHRKSTGKREKSRGKGSTKFKNGPSDSGPFTKDNVSRKNSSLLGSAGIPAEQSTPRRIVRPVSFDDALTFAIPGSKRIPKPSPIKELKSSCKIIDRRYRVLRCLGEGAMGAVYEVQHVRLNKHFAMKIIHPQLEKSKKTIALFHREAQALSRLDHPNCVGVTDFGETRDGDFYIVMQKVEGESLRAIVDRGPLSVREAMEVTRQILLGLGHAHRAGIVHRDIKLENIIKTEDEFGQVVIKIIDFGLAKIKMPKEDCGALTDTGMIPGTPQYVAPETILSQTVDQQSDLYAVGVTLYRMLTGRPPWLSDDIGEIIQAKVRKPIPRLRDAGAGVFPKSLDDFVAKSMSLPEKRFGAASQMLGELEDVQERIKSSKNRIGRFTVNTLRPVTAAFRDYGKKVTQGTLDQGKKMSSKISSDFSRWWRTTPAY